MFALLLSFFRGPFGFGGGFLLRSFCLCVRFTYCAVCLLGSRYSRREDGEFRRGWGRWRQGQDACLLQRDIALAGGDAQERAAVADGSVDGVLAAVLFSALDLAEVAFDVSVGGVELVGEAGLLGDGDADGAVAIFDGDVGERGRAGDVDRAVAIGDRDVAGDAVERDVAAMGGEGEGADGFTGGESGGVADVDLAVEAAELEVGAAGVEFDGAANAFKVGVAEEFAAHGEGAAEVGDGGVVTAAFDGERAGDAVGGDVGVAVVDASGDVAGDGAELDVAVIGGDVDGRFDGGDLHIAPIGGDGGG